MPESGGVESLVHLAIFVVGLIALGVTALALLERLSPSDTPVVRSKHAVLAIGLFVLLMGAELAYHVLS